MNGQAVALLHEDVGRPRGHDPPKFTQGKGKSLAWWFFQQGLDLVFGANIGTTGTGWPVALIAVHSSITTSNCAGPA